MIQNMKNTLLNKLDNARISSLKEHTEGLQTEIYFLRLKTYMKCLRPRLPRKLDNKLPHIPSMRPTISRPKYTTLKNMEK